MTALLVASGAAGAGGALGQSRRPGKAAVAR